jgi:two-component sensor histidine kinase
MQNNARANRHGSLDRASLAVIALMFLALITVLAIWLVSSYRSTVERGEERVVAASKIVAANASWLNSLARVSLKRIDISLEGPVASAVESHISDLNSAVADLPPKVTALIYGPDGDALFQSGEIAGFKDVTHQPFFIRLRNGADDYTSSLIVSASTGRQTFVLSRRIERNHAFAGIAAIAFDTGYLKPVWDVVALGHNSTISLIRRDGELITRHPDPEGPVNMRDYPLFTYLLRKATSGTYNSVSPVDHQERMVAYRALDRTPFVAVASADLEVIMKPFWDNAKIAALLVVFATVGAAAAALWIKSLVKAEKLHTLQLAEALETNQTLMREIHHRVKNNLQTVMALLRMQGFDPEAVQPLNDRIAAMSSVHEQMYAFDQFTGVSARDFLPSFVTKLVGLYDRDVSCEFDIDNSIIGPDKATPFALLLNEVLTNCMKYAFVHGEKGTIRVMLRSSDEERSVLTVSDDGIGYDGKSARPGMGTRLIKAFVSQLHGDFEYLDDRGTKFSATIDIS